MRNNIKMVILHSVFHLRISNHFFFFFSSQQNRECVAFDRHEVALCVRLGSASTFFSSRFQLFFFFFFARIC